MKNWPLIFLLAILVSISALGCATMPEFMDRAYDAQRRARDAGFDKEYVNASGFELMTYRRFTPLEKGNSLMGPETIRIYIEGDGRAWETRSRLSDDPTPSDPIALGLATVDPSNNVAYIARPGQFTSPDATVCDSTYWSAKRFAPEVVETFDKIIDILKKKSGVKNVELVGYSGGGAIAVLVAARRNDITGLRTVAGNLNPKLLCSYHNVSQLDGSMYPLDVAQKVAQIPQRHFIGSKDNIVPSLIVESFVKKKGDTDCKSITIMDSATHKDGWRERWVELLSMPLYKH